jgi:hypothetical protein
MSSPVLGDFPYYNLIYFSSKSRKLEIIFIFQIRKDTRSLRIQHEFPKEVIKAQKCIMRKRELCSHSAWACILILLLRTG